MTCSVLMPNYFQKSKPERHPSRAARMGRGVPCSGGWASAGPPLSPLLEGGWGGVGTLEAKHGGREGGAASQLLSDC